MKYGLILVTLILTGSSASDQSGLWSSADLQSTSRALSKKLDANQRGLQQLADFGTHSVLLVYRESSAEAASHDGTDFYVVQEGEGTLIVGGEIVDPKPVSASEVRGPSIRGGQKSRIRAGDVVNIPPRVAHQILLDAGKTISYLVVKIP